MSNATTLRTLRAGGTVTRIAGAGLPCRVITTLTAAGRLDIVRTGAVTIYRLKRSA